MAEVEPQIHTDLPASGGFTRMVIMSEPSEKQRAFVAVYSPPDHSKVAMARMILDREGVIYYIENELAALGTPAVVAALRMRVMVQADRADECKRLLQEELGL